MMIEKILKVASEYKKVYIQFHNGPDADAISSGIALKFLFDRENIDSEIIYFGPKIKKPNVALMSEYIDYDLQHVTESFTLNSNELLILVDCQVGNSNLTMPTAGNIACIDHHTVELLFPYKFSDIRPEVGACVTLIIEYFNELGITVPSNISTLAYFGLRTDTSNFMVKFTPADNKCKETLELNYDSHAVSKLLRASLHFADIDLFNEALRNVKMVNNNMIVTHMSDADDIILGQISDLLSEVVNVDTVIVMCEREHVYKFSIRAYHEHILANELINYLLRGVGEGGGHPNKSGGVAFKKNLRDAHITNITQYIIDKASFFLKNYLYFENSKDNPIDFFGKNAFKKAFKTLYRIRYLKLSDFFGKEENITFQTLEGTVNVTNDKVIIFGPRAEIYPVDEQLFNRTYRRVDTIEGYAVCDDKLPVHGVTLDSVDNSITITNSTLKMLPLAETTNQNTVECIYLDVPVKIKTKHGNLYSESNAYLMYRGIDDFYLCDVEIFEETFKLVEEHYTSLKA